MGLPEYILSEALLDIFETYTIIIIKLNISTMTKYLAGVPCVSMMSIDQYWPGQRLASNSKLSNVRVHRCPNMRDEE